MRRLTLLVLVGLLGVVSTGFGYDGPAPVTYDRTIDSIRVVMTTQTKMAIDGNSRFSLTAYVPMDIDALNQAVDIEIRKSTAAGDVILASCTYMPMAHDFQRLIAIPCNRYVAVPYSAGEGAASIYPYVLRRSREASLQKVHNGSAFKIPIQFVYDDEFEANQGFSTARYLGNMASLSYTDLVSRDADYYRITVPAGREVTEISIDFVHGSADLDLFVYNAAREIVGVSDGYSSHELVWFAVVPGGDYFIRVHNFSNTPAFYNLSVAHGTRQTVTIINGPEGAPNPVSPTARVEMWVDAYDWNGSALTFLWTASCPTLPTNGIFTTPAARSTRWDAPSNPSGVQKMCTISVTASNASGQTDTASYVQYVDPDLDYITFLDGPGGTPNPVASGGVVQLNASALDSLWHPLQYHWTASCPFGQNGTFSPNAFAAAPTWTAPNAAFGTEQACTIQVSVNDAFNHSSSASYSQGIERSDVVTFIAGVTGTPNPVASGGSMTLSASAVDSFDHPLTYFWQASCPFASNGTFLPDAFTQNATWVAPANVSGFAQTCSLVVRATDTASASATAAMVAIVNSVPDVVTITSGPTNAPDPVASGGSVALSVAASDSIGHVLSYVWSATCPGGMGNGSFVPGANAQNPTWVAAINVTGTQQTCTITVTVTHGVAPPASASITQRVAPAPHTLLISAGPSGTPNPVASQGVATMSVTASDSYPHTLTYAWSAVCPTLAGSGSFGPQAASTPWTAPINVTGAVQTCTLTVVVSDGQGETATAFTSMLVGIEPHVVSITAGPSGTPNPVASGGNVTLALTAVDAYPHTLSYAWTATCPLALASTGTFVPNAATATPGWMAPTNFTGMEQSCTLSVTVDDGTGHMATGSYVQRISTAPDAITILTGPAGTPNPVASSGAVVLSVSATDAWGHALSYRWQAVCPTLGGPGTFSPLAAGPSPTWTAPANLTGADQTCTLTVTVTDGLGLSTSANYAQVVHSVAHTLTVTNGPSGTPDPVNPGGTVIIRFSAADSLLHALTYTWQASCPGLGGTGTFKPSATVAQPVWVAPLNATGVEQLCTITVTVLDGHGGTLVESFVIRINPTPHLIIIVAGPGGDPNPADAGSMVAVDVVATDTFGHALTYAWRAVCPGLPSHGSFAPSATVQSASWLAPDNATGVAQTCSIAVTVTDTTNESVTASYDQVVRTSVHEIVITTGPTGTPDPVASGGSVVMHLAAEDSQLHALSYAWSVVCPGLPTGGSFFPNGAVSTPVWTAPENLSGASVSCTVSVTISDGQGLSTTATHTHAVSALPDTVTITVGPSATPNPVASGGVVTLGATATDTLSHPISYAWQAVCVGLPSNGAFAPSAGIAAPTWTAPENLGGSQQDCTLTITASDGEGQSDVKTVLVRVEPKPDVVTITAGPAATPNPVASGGQVSLSVTAADSMGHALTYAWEATCAGLPGSGSFSPNAQAAAPAWTAPANLTGGVRSCTLQIAIDDGHGHAATASLSLQVNSLDDTITVTTAAAGNPNPVRSGAPVSLSVGATDSLDHVLAYAWSASCAGPDSGAFIPQESVATPAWTAPVNQGLATRACTLTVTISDGHGQSAVSSFTLQVAPVNEVTLAAGIASSHNPVASGGTTTLGASATNTLNLPLSYTWTSICPGLANDGTFTQPSSPTTPWTAPENPTGSVQVCTIQVFVNDAGGYSASATLAQAVRPLNTFVFLQAAHGDPNPVASGGTATLGVSVVDSLGLTLGYAWSASCPTLGSNGTFNNPGIAAAVWTAPVNVTGSPQTCTLTVTVSDGQDLTQPSAFSMVVASSSQVFTVTGPSGTPNPVTSAGTVTAAVTVTNALGRPLTYAWSAACTGLGANGTFATPSSATTLWIAPSNVTGSAKTCVLTVVISDDLGHSVTRTYTQTVGTNPIVISTVTGGGSGGVGSGGTVGLNILGPDLVGQPLTYLWSASCPGLPGDGSFSAPTSPSPIWTAPGNYTGVPQVCTLTVLIRDGQGQSQTASFDVTVGAQDCTYAVSPGSATLPSTGGTATFTVTATTGCPWTATSAAPWVQFSGTPSGTGNGSFVVSLAATTDPEERVATVTAGTASVQVRQGGKGYTYYLAEGATINGFFDTRIALLNHDLTRTASVGVEFQLKDTATVLTYALTVGPHQRATVVVSQLAQSQPALAVLASAEFSTVVRSNVPLIVDRTMTWDATGYGGHSETSIDAPSAIWYLAEGATIGDFELYYLIQNPNPDPLDNEIEVTYMLPPPAAPIVRTYSMGANTRMNIAVHLEPGLENAEVSAIIRTPSGKPVIVERAMYLSAGGLFYGAGHESAGIRAPRTQWFFAEGATGDFFDLFILIGNPNDQPAHVTATYLFDDGVTCTGPVGNAAQGGTPVVGAKSRQNIWVDLETVAGCPHSLSSAAVSTTITSDLPIVAERTMWWPGPTAATWAEAHNTAGATSTGTRWALADGEQGFAAGVETYVLLANTSAYDGTARVTLYFEDGTSVEKMVELVSRGRTTVPIGGPRDEARQVLGQPERSGFGFGSLAMNRRFGVVVESQPVAGQGGPAQIVVERATYWNGPGAGFWAAGTNALATRLQ